MNQNIVKLWEAIPCRRKRDFKVSPRKAICDTIAHMAKVNGMTIERSPSTETVYLSAGPMKLRISGHSLGRKDYGLTEQSHCGPELIISSMMSPSEVICRMIDVTRAYGRNFIQVGSYNRRSLAKILWGLNRMYHRY